MVDHKNNTFHQNTYDNISRYNESKKKHNINHWIIKDNKNIDNNHNNIKLWSRNISNSREFFNSRWYRSKDKIANKNNILHWRKIRTKKDTTNITTSVKFVFVLLVIESVLSLVFDGKIVLYFESAAAAVVETFSIYVGKKQKDQWKPTKHILLRLIDFHA